MAPSIPSPSVVTRSQRARIAALVACVPESSVENSTLIERFGTAAEQVIKMTGVERRHVVEAGRTTSDLCVTAAKELFQRTQHLPDDIDAILFFTQTPDYRLPATACDIQARLGLRKGIVAFDVNLGCSAYPYALWLGSMMIDSGAASKVLLCVGDTVSRIVAPDDRSTAMLFGDCGTATLLVADANCPTDFVLGSDGSGVSNLIVPEGCFRQGASLDPQNSNPPDTLFMDGGEIFNFTLKAVPSLFSQLCEASKKAGDSFEKVLFHQANAFMINHLRKKIKLDAEKVPVNISRFGNTSSASIPLLMVTECADLLTSAEDHDFALLGFGVGYSWAAASIRIGNLDCVSLVKI
jgi:3-oxoacyl-[acyl-carrier-protein] synthase III